MPHNESAWRVGGIAHTCERAGLNALGWTAIDNDTLALLLVWGSGGPRFALRAFDIHPGPHPVDTHGAALAWELKRALSAHAHVQAVHTPSSVPIFDMAAAARTTGMGTQGRLGILMHPVFGPWWGLRLAITLRCPDLPWRDALLTSMESAGVIVTSALTPPALPCTTCTEPPCVAACPGAALPPDPPSHPSSHDDAFRPPFALQTCVSHVQQGGCPHLCAARAACPAGADHRYPSAVHAHHHQSFRRVLAEHQP